MIMFILFRKQHKADKDVSGNGMKDNMTSRSGVRPVDGVLLIVNQFN